jgi:NAD(P)-dependent dehydrogenase (short-subunit alcohol dehydrogenase family)
LVAGLLDSGAQKVIGCDLNIAGLEQIARAAPDRCQARVLDVTDEAAVHQCASECGDVNLLINCHGIVIHQAFLDAPTIAGFRREMDVNYWGQVMMCRAFARIVGRNGGGAIANFLSPLALVTYPFCGSYCATKAACRALTDSMRAELAAQGTLVVSVFPGAIDTQMMTKLNIPKSQPEVVARGVLSAIAAGDIECWVGETAPEFRDQWRRDPAPLVAEAAKHLALS